MAAKPATASLGPAGQVKIRSQFLAADATTKDLSWSLVGRLTHWLWLAVTAQASVGTLW